MKLVTFMSFLYFSIQLKWPSSLPNGFKNDSRNKNDNSEEMKKIQRER